MFSWQEQYLTCSLRLTREILFLPLEHRNSFFPAIVEYPLCMIQLISSLRHQWIIFIVVHVRKFVRSMYGDSDGTRKGCVNSKHILT